MDTELFELCKEVYKRTRWDSNDLLHRLGDEVFYRELFDSDVDEKHPRASYHPLYTPDYLLEKLPKEHMAGDLTVYWNGDDGCKRWQACYLNLYHVDDIEYQYADTPLKALLKLTIALDDAGQLNYELSEVVS